MEKLGGLIHRMPVTAFAVLVGCAAISALPPFNGFASEWLTFQAILLSPELPQWGLKLIVPAVGALLGAFRRAGGGLFRAGLRHRLFGPPPQPGRGRGAGDRSVFAGCDARAGGRSVCSPASCPASSSMRWHRWRKACWAGTCRTNPRSPWLSLVPISKARSSYNGLLVFLFIAISATFAATVIHRLASKAMRRAPAWDCGFPNAGPLDAIHGGKLFPADPARLRNPAFPRARACRNAAARRSCGRPGSRVQLEDVVWDILYAPLAEGIRVATDRLNVLQFLTIRRYLSLVFVTLVVLLLVVAIWR